MVVADDAGQGEWAHERNAQLAQDLGVPYVRDVEKATSDYGAQVAVISSQAERHCDLAVRAADAGLHVIQDKPMSTSVAECDRAVEAVERNGVKFMMWSRNFIPSLVQTREAIESGAVGLPHAIHVDFYFASDAGPPKGSRKPSEPPIDWYEYQKQAHATGRDGGVGSEPMGELKIEGIYPLAYIRMLIGAEVERVFARTASHFHQVNVDNDVEDLASVTLEMEARHRWIADHRQDRERRPHRRSHDQDIGAWLKGCAGGERVAPGGCRLSPRAGEGAVQPACRQRRRFPDGGELRTGDRH